MKAGLGDGARLGGAWGGMLGLLGMMVRMLSRMDRRCCSERLREETFQAGRVCWKRQAPERREIRYGVPVARKCSKSLIFPQDGGLAPGIADRRREHKPDHSHAI